MDIYERVGSRIRETRIKRDIPAKQLADVLDCSLASISNYEKAKRWISLVDLERAAEFLGEPLSYFIEENPSEKRSQPPRTSAERKILNAVKDLGGIGHKELPEKATSLFRKILEAKYTILFLVNKNNEFVFANSSGINQSLLKKLEDLLSLSASNYKETRIRFKMGKKLKSIFNVSKPYLSSDIAALLLECGAKRLSLLTPSLLSLAKFEAVLLLPLKTNHSPVGFLISCFENLREAERWKNSELLVFFNQYVAQLLENARLLEGTHKKEHKRRSTVKIEIEEPAPAPLGVAQTPSISLIPLPKRS